MSKNKILYLLLTILILLVAFQYSAWGVEEWIYNPLRSFIIGLILLCFTLSVRGISSSIIKESIIVVHFLSIVILFVFMILVTIIGLEVNLSPLRDSILSLLILFIGYNFKVSNTNIEKLSLLFIVSFTIASLSIVLKYAQGFTINENYLPIPKNQFSPVYGVAFILAIYYWPRFQGTKKVILSICIFSLFISLLVIRGRSTLVSVMFVTLIFLIYYLKSKEKKVVGLFVLITSLFLAFPYIYDALLLNYDIHEINSVSTGRTQVYTDAITYLKDNYLLGDIGEKFISDGIVHNYLLYNLVNYGVFLSLPLIVTYFSYFFIIIKFIFKNTYKSYEFASLTLLIIYLTSLFEYTYPYAPGSSILIPTLFFGVLLRRQRLLKNNQI